jgi:hypothetical protein
MHECLTRGTLWCFGMKRGLDREHGCFREDPSGSIADVAALVVAEVRGYCPPASADLVLWAVDGNAPAFLASVSRRECRAWRRSSFLRGLVAATVEVSLTLYAWLEVVVRGPEMPAVMFHMCMYRERTW